MRHEIIPNLRYADAVAGIDFLCNAFGFERRAVSLAAEDAPVVQHAQLTWADRMVMVASINDTQHAWATNMKTVVQAGGHTVGLYLVVADVDAHADQAPRAGADIMLGPQDQRWTRIFRSRSGRRHLEFRELRPLVRRLSQDRRRLPGFQLSKRSAALFSDVAAARASGVSSRTMR